MVTVCSLLQAMASTEERAYEIMRELDVSYVLVIFGGLTGYSSDGTSQITVTMHIYRLYFYYRWRLHRVGSKSLF